MRARFIVLEGPDGSGTTTHAEILSKRLIEANVPIFQTCEPTAGPVGTAIRQHLLKGDLPASALQLLFCADRAWHVEREILPALEEETTVICDRYALSTIVYGEALGLDADWLEELNKKFIQPDLQILLLPPFEATLDRVGKRDVREVLEEDSLMRRVYDAYAKRGEELGLPTVDTAGDKEDVARRILQIVTSH